MWMNVDQRSVVYLAPSTGDRIAYHGCVGAPSVKSAAFLAQARKFRK
jgi:hypothetical protein